MQRGGPDRAGRPARRRRRPERQCGKRHRERFRVGLTAGRGQWKQAGRRAGGIEGGREDAEEPDGSDWWTVSAVFRMPGRAAPRRSPPDPQARPARRTRPGVRPRTGLTTRRARNPRWTGRCPRAYATGSSPSRPRPSAASPTRNSRSRCGPTPVSPRPAG
ncbi:hypothetical protein SBRY_20822 [Actinacidiphila bryophytorum]|uniref:Uncharacterized protein n=1 Tax=Actinacidiphila bryophytorum TaxID=1436133 RepID=A0A9W4GZT7_9ACTN|nr:hypothetical protein SBRY_20822 [Actinacidiphila bryophytorum]